MTTRFYKRSGERVSREWVHAKKKEYAFAKRVGLSTPFSMSAQPRVADSIDRMTDEEFCDWSGAFTYRKV
jgi:hypothetical protein